MTLLIDMNLSPLWVAFLRERGFAAVHWSSVGPATAPDTEIIDYARRNAFVVFTHDLDFGRILAIGGESSPSVVQIRAQNILPSAIGDLVVNALQTTSSHIDVGALVTIDPFQNRVRLLPI